ncbi:putative F-box domain-containing protein [Tanacetum coccineum]
MSDNIPIEIQSEIMKRLPIKPLIQFRLVSKAWKSLIDSSMFINGHIQTQTQTKPQAHHVLIRYEIDDYRICLSLRDDDSFPNDRFNHTVPEFVNLLRNQVLLGSSHGVVCFYGSYLDMGLEIMMTVLWNPTVRKSVGIVVPNVVSMPLGNSFVGFGVCADTSDIKILKINVFETPGVHWEKEEFGEAVCLPNSLVHSDDLTLFKRNESLAVVDSYIETEDETLICDVWRMKDGVTKSFTKMFSLKTLNLNEIEADREILGFRKNGEAITERLYGQVGSRFEVYDPSSQRIDSIRIAGNVSSFLLTSYIETILLLDESNSIIR